LRGRSAGRCSPTRAPTWSRSGRRGWETFSGNGVGVRDQRDSLWWRVAGRNKRSITVDLRTPDGQDLLRRLVRDVDIVIENFRPGTLERRGLGYDELTELNPGLILVRISGFGQTGPYATRAGYAAIGEAMGGLRALTGYADRPPTRVGVSLGDSLTGLMGAWGAVCAAGPAVAPRLSETPGSIRWGGPLLGQHTTEVLKLAGLVDDDIAKLHDTGVI
jgi:crotonobetainyl-CoA:carnitine CoA-transferase CaiB-like acyl-CoA transferase